MNGLMYKMQDVTREVKNHFEVRFQDSTYRRPHIAGSSFKCLEDLKVVIWVGAEDKILGPYGFKFRYIELVGYL